MTEDTSRESVEEDEQASSKPASLWSELKRRHVIRVASVYAVVAWLIIQVASTTFESFGIPDWAFRFVVILLLLGFPISLIVAWALELTPDGIKRTNVAHSANNATAASLGIQAKRRWLSIVFAAAVPCLLFVILVLVFNLRPVDDAPLTTSSESGSEEISIAVLPLTNMSSHVDNAFFTGGVHEDILTNLSRIDNLHIISRTSVMRFLNSEKSLRDIGVALGARYIVEGSVRRIDNHVRVTVQLIDALKDKHLWASNYDRELVDVFAIQSAVAKEISNSIHLEVQPESVGTLQGMPTHSVKAYDLYIKAQSIERSEPASELSLTRQVELLEAAVEEDPNFVEVWGYLNSTLDQCIFNIIDKGWFIPESENGETILRVYQDKAQRALDKAIALDPDNIQTLLARAGDYEAERNVKGFHLQRKQVIDQVLEKDPENAVAWFILGWWYADDGDSEAAKLTFIKALKLDPLHVRMVDSALVYFRYAGDQEMVTKLFELLSKLAPEKAELTNLGEVTFSALQDAFMQTGDLAILDMIAEKATKTELVMSEVASLWEYQNNLDELLKEHDDISPSKSVSETVANAWLNTSLLAAQELAGSAESAKVIAQRIIDISNNEIVLIANSETIHNAYVNAYAVLGERSNAQKWVDKLLNERSGKYNGYGVWGFMALAQLDVDRAVKLILEEKAKHPNWTGTNLIAVHHIVNRKIIVHPDMQAYYLKEGKWIDYLAERVPEYAIYKIQK